MTRPSRLPPIVGEFFLAGDGFLGFRCFTCPFVCTGRTMHAVDDGMIAHHAHCHADEVTRAEITGEADA